MTTTRHDSEFEARSKAAFDENVDGLDAATRSRLARARNRALRELQKPTLVPAWALGNARAIAAVAVAAVLGSWLFVTADNAPQPGLQNIAEVSDLELLLESDELEMFEELEFYAWLDEQTESQPPATPQPGDGAG